MITLSWKNTVPLLHGTFCSDMTSNILFVMYDTPSINGCVREKMHPKRCTVHHTVDPTILVAMYTKTWTVRCAHTLDLFGQVSELRSFCGQICRFLLEESGHQDIRTSWSESHLRPCSLTKAPQKPASSPSLHRRVFSHRLVHPDSKQGEAVKQWDLREDESTWIHFTNVWHSATSHVWRAVADAAGALYIYNIYIVIYIYIQSIFHSVLYWSNILVCKWLSSFGQGNSISTVGVISGDFSQFMH